MKTEDCTTSLGHRVATRNLNRIILLPLELKQRICSYLTPKHFKFFRLTSRDHAAAASRYLLPRIFLLNHPDSSQGIRDIARHQLLSLPLTMLVIDVSCLRVFQYYESCAHISNLHDLGHVL